MTNYKKQALKKTNINANRNDEKLGSKQHIKTRNLSLIMRNLNIETSAA